MDLIDKMTLAEGLQGFLVGESQERIVRVLTKIFEKKGTKRGIEECAVTMKSLADQVYKARKLSREKHNVSN